MIKARTKFFSFQWHITDCCDQRCSHCYIYAENPYKVVTEMSFQQMEKTMERCLEFCKRFHRQPWFCITGGDPLLHKDFWKLIDLCKKQEIPFSIMGNPYHLNDEVCQKLKDAGCRQYQVSLDGLQQTHDRFRREGSFQETLSKIACINDAGIQSIVMTTVSGENIAEIPALIDLIVQYNVGIYGFARLCPSKTQKDIGIAPLEYRKFLEVCDKKFEFYTKQGCYTIFSRKDHLWTLYEYEIGRFRIPSSLPEGMIYGGCNCGNQHITILPTGEVWACRRVSHSCVGNIYNTPLESLWCHEMEAYRDYEKFHKCAKCELLSWCRGCPAVAKGTSGSFYGEDPQCWKTI